MSDSYEVLYGKYQRAIISINELEQEKELYKQQADELRAEHKMIEKNATTLCETILKKEQEKSGEKKWFKMPVNDMILAAQDSIERYYPNLDETIKKLLERNTERTDRIRELEKEMRETEEEHRKETDAAIAEKDVEIATLREAVGKADADIKALDEEIRRKQEKVRNDAEASEESEGGRLNGLSDRNISSKNTSFTVEEGDGMEIPVSESVNIMYGSSDTGTAIESPNYYEERKAGRKIRNAVREKAEEMDAKRGNELKKDSEDLDPKSIELLKIYGDTGVSEWKDCFEIYRKGRADAKGNTTMSSCLKQLVDGGYIEQVKIKAPGTPNLVLQRLTDEGRGLYEALFEKEPAEPYMNMIIRHHSSLAHGYGIRNCADLIRTMKFVADGGYEVAYLTRMSEYTVKTGENSSYIPDIVLIRKVGTGEDEKTQKLRIEYETGDCSDADFFAKCEKIATFSTEIPIIVPDAGAKEITLEKAEKWGERMKGREMPGGRPVTVRVSSYADLQTAMKNGKCDKGMYWDRAVKITGKGAKRMQGGERK